MLANYNKPVGRNVPCLVSSSMASNEATTWIPAKFDPSFTSTKAKFFCLRTVLTHPFTTTGPSLGPVASTAFTRGMTPVDDKNEMVLASRTGRRRWMRCNGLEKVKAKETPGEVNIARHIVVAKQRSTLCLPFIRWTTSEIKSSSRVAGLGISLYSLALEQTNDVCLAVRSLFLTQANGP